jgi:hypothetical protein
MSQYHKFNLVYRLQKWMDSVPGQTFLNYAYSWGASIVILGTLFKLTHLPAANLMLFIGMGTEVFVFFISAFDRPFDKTEVGKDLPTHVYAEGEQPIIVGGGVIPQSAVNPSETLLNKEALEGDDGSSEGTDEKTEIRRGPVVIGGGQPIAGGGQTIVGGGQTIVGGGQTVVGGGQQIVGGGSPSFVVGGTSGSSESSETSQETSSEVSQNEGNVTGGTQVSGGGNISGGGTIVIGGGFGGRNGGTSQHTDAQEESSEPIAEGQEQTLGTSTPVSAEQLAAAVNQAAWVQQQQQVSPEMEEATNKYVEELKKLTEMLSKVSDQSERLTRDSEEMENLNRTLTGICKIYEMQLKGASAQVGTIDQINEESRKMASQIEQLNKIYARMIEAMTVNMKAAAPTANLDTNV